MRRIFIISSVILKEWIRSPSGVFFSLLFPLLLFVVLSSIFGDTSSVKYDIHVLNLDVYDNGTPTNISKAFIKALNSTESFNIIELDRKTNITKFLNATGFKSRRLLVIPQGFEEKIINRTVVIRLIVILDTLERIKVENESIAANISMGIKMLREYINRTNTTSPEVILFADSEDSSTPIIRGILYSVIQSFNNRLVSSTEVISLKEEDILRRKLSAADYYLPSFIASFIMTNGVMGLTSVVADYRRRGIIRRLICTPLRRYEWIIGCMLQQAFLGFIITISMIILGYFIFGVKAIPDAYSLLLIMLGAVAFSSIGMVLGGIAKDPEAASAIGNAIGFPIMFLSGAFWPIEIMPSYMQVVAKFTPLYYFHQGLRETLIYGNPVNAIPSFIILSVMTIVFILLAVKVTKWKDL